MFAMSTKREWDAECQRDFSFFLFSACSECVCFLNVSAHFYANLQKAFICVNTHKHTHLQFVFMYPLNLSGAERNTTGGFCKGFTNRGPHVICACLALLQQVSGRGGLKCREVDTLWNRPSALAEEEIIYIFLKKKKLQCCDLQNCSERQTLWVEVICWMCRMRWLIFLVFRSCLKHSRFESYLNLLETILFH